MEGAAPASGLGSAPAELRASPPLGLGKWAVLTVSRTGHRAQGVQGSLEKRVAPCEAQRPRGSSWWDLQAPTARAALSRTRQPSLATRGQAQGQGMGPDPSSSLGAWQPEGRVLGPSEPPFPRLLDGVSRGGPGTVVGRVHDRRCLQSAREHQRVWLCPSEGDCP